MNRMRSMVGFCLWLCAGLWLQMSAHAADVPRCSDQQLKAATLPEQTGAGHRQFSLPDIIYPYGSQKDVWGLRLQLRVDAHGQVVCYRAGDRYEHAQTVDQAEHMLLRQLGSWHYAPYLDKGQPTAATVLETVEEREAPGSY